MTDSASAVGTFAINIELDGAQHSFACRSDQTVLDAAEDAGVPLPSSCGAGMCTNCAAEIIDGSVDQADAMGVNQEMRDKGYALLCVACPRSDLKILGGQEDALYEAQFGDHLK